MKNSDSIEQVINNTIDKSKVIGLLKSNKKIAAIKYIREQTGFGLKQSKNIADNLAANSNFYGGGYPDFEASTTQENTTPQRGNHIKVYNTNRNNKLLLAILIAIILSIYLFFDFGW